MTYLRTPSGEAGDEDRPVVRSKTGGIFGEACWGTPPNREYIGNDKTIFLEDHTGRFKRLLLAGRESDMVLLGVLTYALLDMATANTFVAIFAAYAMDVGVRKVRAELATKNIAAKTLLDDRFLL